MKSELQLYKNGDRIWKLPNGDFHREDGPAIDFINKLWFLNNIEYTEEEYKYKMRLKKLEHIL